MQRRKDEKNNEHAFMTSEYDPMVPNDYYDMQQYVKRLPSIRILEKEQLLIERNTCI
jgi:hypothetical protein